MEAADFIATCQRLQSLDFSGPVAIAAQATLEEVNVRFALPSRNHRGQWHELLQHLTDLAYLTPARLVEWHGYRARGEAAPKLLRSRVVVAALVFVKEDDPTAYPVPPPVQGGNSSDWVEDYLSLIVHRAGLYTSLDGDLPPRPDYLVGSENAFGRSLAFRLRVYFQAYTGRHSARRKTYFDADLFPLLYSLDNSLRGEFTALLPGADAKNIHVSIQQLLLSGQYLFDAFRSANRFGEGTEEPYFLAYAIDDETAASVRGRANRLRKRADRRLDRNELHIDTGTNQLAVRLLQIGLWRAGFYTGVLDGAFGPLTHQALQQLIEQERQENEQGAGTRVLRNGQLERLLLRADNDGEGVWLVDLRLLGVLLDAYAPPPLSQARAEEDAIWERIRGEGLEDRLDREFSDRQQELRPNYGALDRYPDRRVYFGLRGLIRGAFRAIGRIVAWIAGAVTAIIGAVFDFVKSIVKRLQDGIGQFFTGFGYFIQFALGRPIFTKGEAQDGRTPLMATSFRIDFDVTSWMANSATGGDVRAHATNLRRAGEGLARFMETVTSVISLVARMSSPIGWLRLAVMIARYVFLSFRPEEEKLVV